MRKLWICLPQALACRPWRKFKNSRLPGFYFQSHWFSQLHRIPSWRIWGRKQFQGFLLILLGRLGCSNKNHSSLISCELSLTVKRMTEKLSALGSHWRYRFLLWSQKKGNIYYVRSIWLDRFHIGVYKLCITLSY